MDNGVFWKGADGKVYVKGSQGVNVAGNWDKNTVDYWTKRGFGGIADPNPPKPAWQKVNISINPQTQGITVAAPDYYLNSPEFQQSTKKLFQQLEGKPINDITVKGLMNTDIFKKMQKEADMTRDRQIQINDIKGLIGKGATDKDAFTYYQNASASMRPDTDNKTQLVIGVDSKGKQMTQSVADTIKQFKSMDDNLKANIVKAYMDKGKDENLTPTQRAASLGMAAFIQGKNLNEASGLTKASAGLDQFLASSSDSGVGKLVDQLSRPGNAAAGEGWVTNAELAKDTLNDQNSAYNLLTGTDLARGIGGVTGGLAGFASDIAAGNAVAGGIGAGIARAATGTSGLAKGASTLDKLSTSIKAATAARDTNLAVKLGAKSLTGVPQDLVFGGLQTVGRSGDYDNLSEALQGMVFNAAIPLVGKGAGRVLTAVDPDALPKAARINARLASSINTSIDKFTDLPAINFIGRKVGGGVVDSLREGRKGARKAFTHNAKNLSDDIVRKGLNKPAGEAITKGDRALVARALYKQHLNNLSQFKAKGAGIAQIVRNETPEFHEMQKAYLQVHELPDNTAREINEYAIALHQKSLLDNLGKEGRRSASAAQIEKWDNIIDKYKDNDIANNYAKILQDSNNAIATSSHFPDVTDAELVNRLREDETFRNTYIYLQRELEPNPDFDFSKIKGWSKRGEMRRLTKQAADEYLDPFVSLNQRINALAELQARANVNKMFKEGIENGYIAGRVIQEPETIKKVKGLEHVLKGKVNAGIKSKGVEISAVDNLINNFGRDLAEDITRAVDDIEDLYGPGAKRLDTLMEDAVDDAVDIIGKDKNFDPARAYLKEQFEKAGVTYSDDLANREILSNYQKDFLKGLDDNLSKVKGPFRLNDEQSGMMQRIFKTKLDDATQVARAESQGITVDAVDEFGKPFKRTPENADELAESQSIAVDANDPLESLKAEPKAKTVAPQPTKGAKKHASAIEALESPELRARWDAINKQKQAANQKVTKTSNNLYHTTKAENLDSIAKEGLVTGKPARYEGVSSKDKISFSANEAAAKYYGGDGDIMIRTKRSYKPDDLDIDPLAGGNGTYTTGKSIPPNMLEVKINGKWTPLEQLSKQPPKPATAPKTKGVSKAVDPLESLRLDTPASLRDRNEELKKLRAELGDKTSSKAVPIWENGTKGYIEVDDPVLRNFLVTQASNPANMGYFNRMMMNSARIFREMTTGLNPVFGFAVNPVRDTPTALLTTGTGILDGKTSLGTMMDVAGVPREQSRRVLSRMAASGGGSTRVESGRIAGTNILAETKAAVRAREAQGIKEKTVNIFKDIGSGKFRALEDINPVNVVEQLERGKISASAFAKAKASGLSDELAEAAGVQAYRDAITDFNNIGSKIENFTKTVPYLAAGINGTASFSRMMQLDPLGVASRLVAGVAMPVTMITMNNLRDEGNANVYLDMPEWERRNNLVIMLPGQNILKIPLPQEVVPITSSLVDAVESLHGTDPGVFDIVKKAFGNFGANALEGLSPADLSGFQDEDVQGNINVGNAVARAAGSVLPQALRSPTELLLGKDLYTGQDIRVSDEDIRRQLGLDPDTPITADMRTRVSGNSKTLGFISGITNIPQSALQNVFKNYGGTVGQFVLNGIDKLAGAPSAEQGGKGVMDNASRRFFGKSYSQATQDFWTGVNRLDNDKAKIQQQLDEFAAMARNNPDRVDEITDRRQALIDSYANKVGDFIHDYGDFYQRAGGIKPNQIGTLIHLLNFNQNSGTFAPESFQSGMENDASLAAYNEARLRAIQQGVPITNPRDEFGRLVRDDTGAINQDFSRTNLITPTIAQAYYDAPKQAAFEFKKAIRADKQAGIPSLNAERQKFWDELSPLYERARGLKGEAAQNIYSQINNLQEVYMSEVFDERIRPLLNKWGPGILTNRDVLKELAGQIMIPGDYTPFFSKKKTPYLMRDTEAYLQDRYGVGDLNQTNMPTSKEAQTMIAQINKDIDAGRAGAASFKLQRLQDAANSGKVYVNQDAMNNIRAALNPPKKRRR